MYCDQSTSQYACLTPSPRTTRLAWRTGGGGYVSVGILNLDDSGESGGIIYEETRNPNIFGYPLTIFFFFYLVFTNKFPLSRKNKQNHSQTRPNVGRRPLCGGLSAPYSLTLCSTGLAVSLNESFVPDQSQHVCQVLS